MADTEELIKKRIKDAPITFSIAQFLDAYILGDSAAVGTGNILGKTLVDYIISKMVDVVCKTQAELSAALTSNAQSVILWTGSDATLLDGMSVTLGCEKIIYMHRHLLGTNCTILAPAGCSLTVYGDFYAGAHSEDGWSWKLNSQQNGTSSIRVKWLRNASEGKIICDTGTVLYERLESGLTLETNGTPGSESYINQEFWDNTNDGSLFLGDGKVLRSSDDDSGRGFFADKIAESEWIHKYQITESGIKKLQLALANPDYFVKGNTIYGGSIVTNLDTLVHNGGVTCYGTAVGAPNASYSWFVDHQNSNAGTTYAYQKAVAFAESLIIYDRIKYAGVWQPWILRVGTGVSEIGYVASGDSLGAVATIALQAGSTSQWSAHAVMCAATGKLTPAVGTSLFGFIVPQTVVGGHFIGAVYKVEDNGVHSKICSTGITEMPTTPQWTHSLISSLVTDKFIAPTERIYLTVMTDCNGVAVAGANAGSNLNLPPYIAAIKTNMGILTEAPATIQFESETNLRPFIYLVK